MRDLVAQHDHTLVKRKQDVLHCPACAQQLIVKFILGQLEQLPVNPPRYIMNHKDYRALVDNFGTGGENV